MNKDKWLLKFAGIVKNNNYRIPSIPELKKLGWTRAFIRHHFGSFTEMREQAIKKHPEVFSKILDERKFTSTAYKKLQQVNKKYKRFVITTAVVGSKVHEGFYKSIKSYCKKNKAALLVLPCADPAQSGSWNLDNVLLDEFIVFKDLKLNSNFFVSAIKLSAKQIKPLTGLSRIGQRRNSFVFASPKQDLEVVPVSKQRLGHVLMSTGALTLPNYNTESYMSERTAYIARHDHVMGAIIVEIRDNKLYHFRQVQADEKGNFIDLGVEYDASGQTKRVAPAALILGDYHAGETCPKAKKASLEMAKATGASRVVLHDFFNGRSISHHYASKKITKAKARDSVGSLENELRITYKEILDLNKVFKELVVIKSNHDEWLDRYLDEGRYIDEPENKRLALQLALKLYDSEDVLKAGLELVANNPKDLEKLIWIDRDMDYTIAGVELGEHGDLGSDGSRGTLASIEKALGSAVIGHSHTPAILRAVFRVGTLTKLQLDYNRGASGWANANCFLYPNGSRQLIFIIDGLWRL